MGVAPVSRWQLAGALETRRLMGGAELEDNWAGYSEADLTRCSNNSSHVPAPSYLLLDWVKV